MASRGIASPATAADQGRTPVAFPPRSALFWFWVLGRRLDPAYRPWVARQVVLPSYARRRTLAMSALQTALVTGPQMILGLVEHSRVRVGLFAFVGLYWLVLPVVRRPYKPAVVAQLLAYHGVRSDGVLETPVSAWSLNAFGRSGVALLTAQLLLIASGGAVVYDRLMARSLCHHASPQALAELDALLGQPGLVQGFNPPPSVPLGALLVRAREVDQGLPGISYLAAYARVPGRPDVGPGVWRVIAPGGALAVPALTLSGANDKARALTPTLGYGFNTPPDPRIRQVLDCLPH